MYAYIHVHIYIHTCIHTYVYVCIYIYIHNIPSPCSVQLFNGEGRRPTVKLQEAPDVSADLEPAVKSKRALHHFRSFYLFVYLLSAFLSFSLPLTLPPLHAPCTPCTWIHMMSHFKTH